MNRDILKALLKEAEVMFHEPEGIFGFPLSGSRRDIFKKFMGLGFILDLYGLDKNCRNNKQQTTC